MRLFFSLALIGLFTSFSAQETITYPYNPDGDADGQIAAIDIQAFLSVYGLEFSPGEILMDSIPLSSYLMFLQESLVNQQIRMDSLEISLLMIQGIPQISEYSTCWITNSYVEPLMSNFQSCCDSKVAEGWIPQGGFHKDGSNAVQAFVKYND